MATPYTVKELVKPVVSEAAVDVFTPDPLLENDASVGRRRVPRRVFEAPVGVLLHGEFSVQQSFQVGEGGMMITSSRPLLRDELLVTSFYLPGCGMIIVRAVVRATVPETATMPLRYGLEFQNLDFQHKREIRNFVASSSRGDSYSGF